MNCTQWQAQLSAYCDNESSLLQRHRLEGHLRACSACATIHKELRAEQALRRAALPYFDAPAQLHARIHDLLDKSANAPAPPSGTATRARWTWLAGGALGGCAATLVALATHTAWVDWRAHEDVIVEAVAEHVQAQQGQRLIEVESSDQHTVKPWLSARLDYAPPVRDFAAAGFALAGARIDMLHGQRVATLVYHYRRHVIDVYVRPEPVPVLGAPRTVRGFHAVQVSAADMNWLLVSDASVDVLADFAAQLASR